MESRSNPIQQIRRPEHSYPPSLWGDMFHTFDEEKHIKIIEDYTKVVQELKEIVRNMITLEETSITSKTVLIDTIERLGLAYHFEQEIEDQVAQIFNFITSPKGHEDDEDLFSVSLLFRLLRQHGFKISCDVFKRFKSDAGGFNDALTSDIRGILSLYEASHWRTHEDYILEEALSFTTHHLKSFVVDNSCNDSTLLKQVVHALHNPLHKGIPRVETLHFISIYQECDPKQEILQLAKIDFNLLQILHKKELSQLSRWWKSLDIISKLGYARDRLVECYFWALSVFYEPQHSLDRIAVAKFLVLATVTDDTYDTYATLEELKVFTNAVQRWSIGELDTLPDYMKIIYSSFLNLVGEFENRVTTRDEEKAIVINVIIEAFQEFIRGYHTEAEWSKRGSFPEFDEYMRIGTITSSYWVLIPISWLGILNTLDQNTIHGVISKLFKREPKFIEASGLIARMIDDISTFKREKEMDQEFTGVDCYMKQYRVSKEETFQKFNEICDNGWKDLNEGFFKPTIFPKAMISAVFNLCRGTNFLYMSEHDSYTYPAEDLKPIIISLLVEPLPT